MHWLLGALIPVLLAASPVTVYKEVSFSGDYLGLDETQRVTALPGSWSYEISSLMIKPGYEFIAYSPGTNVNYLGQTPYIILSRQDIPSLHRLWTKNIESYEVRRKSPFNPNPSGYLLAVVYYSESNFRGLAYYMTDSTLPIVSAPIRDNISSIAVSPGYELVATDAMGNNKSIIDDNADLGDWNKKIVSLSTATNSNNLALLDLSNLYKVRLDSGALRLDKIVGRGSFADVWKGTYDGTTVAVKRLQSGRHSNREIQDFINEMQLMA
ncbi:hypothetical protein ACHHYP_13504, partial [Achlya hypogyna]